MNLTEIQKENIVGYIMKSQIRCKRCSKYDGDRGSTDLKYIRCHCTMDTYDGRNWWYCFHEIYTYIENNNLWEIMIAKHNIKNINEEP